MLDGLSVLPAGTTLPPLPYLLGVLIAAGAVGLAIVRRPPPVTSHHVLALAPWMVLGSALHVLYVIDALPPVLSPLAGSPTVYVTVAILAGTTWLTAAEIALGDTQDGGATSDRVPTLLAVVGGILVVPVVSVAVLGGVSSPGVMWSVVAFVATIPLTAGIWIGLTRAVPETNVTGGVGALVVFGHALDGVSTAVGVTQLGFGERTPLSRVILELGGVPAVPVLGEGWVFLLVKLGLASGIVWLFGPYVREEPTEGLLLLGFVAAVGLGPAAHNLLLFSVAG